MCRKHDEAEGRKVGASRPPPGKIARRFVLLPGQSVPFEGLVDEPAHGLKTAMGLIRDGSRRSDPPSNPGGTRDRYAMLLLGLAMVGTLVPNLVLPTDN
jgi:hypothetical protein